MPQAINPNACAHAITPDLARLPRKTVLGLLDKLLLIRIFEEKVVGLYGEQEIQTPVHLCIGQEAIAAGVCQALAPTDLVFSTHRSHGHYLAKGGDLYRLTAELYGRAGGCSGGKGGSMHVVDTDCGVCGSTAIVGGGIPLAVGMALASSIRKDRKVTVSFFGDGAVDEGVFHESLSFASLKQLPVVFAIENNFYATCSPQCNRQPQTELHSFARAYGIPAAQVDGNDAAACYRAARRAVRRARSDRGPTLLEFKTYRWMGHVGTETDQHKDYRPQHELEQWMQRCPLDAFIVAMTNAGVLDADQIATRSEAIRGRVDEAFVQARQSPFPEPSELYDNVW